MKGIIREIIFGGEGQKAETDLVRGACLTSRFDGDEFPQVSRFRFMEEIEPRWSNG